MILYKNQKGQFTRSPDFSIISSFIPFWKLGANSKCHFQHTKSPCITIVSPFQHLKFECSKKYRQSHHQLYTNYIYNYLYITRYEIPITWHIRKLHVTCSRHGAAVHLRFDLCRWSDDRRPWLQPLHPHPATEGEGSEKLSGTGLSSKEMGMPPAKIREVTWIYPILAMNDLNVRLGIP
jgi:hypothetical protein